MPSFLEYRDFLLGTERIESSLPVNMLPDEQIQGKNPHPVNKEEHMPFSHSVLTKSLIDYAVLNLNETQEVREKSLKVIQEYMKNDLDFHHSINDAYLLCYLRSRKFDIKRTCLLMKKTLEFSKSYRQYIDRLDVQAVRQVVESNTLGFLPYRDSKSRAIILLRSENWDPHRIKSEEIIFGSIVALHMAVINPINQVAGFVVILDFKNLNIQQIVAMSSWLIFGIQALQRCCPCIVKEFHILHTPAIFRTSWKLVKPLISEKIRNRIIFYKSSNWDSLHRRIPPAILPEELGGQLGPFSNNHWAGDMTSIMKQFDEKIRVLLDELPGGS